MTLLKSTPHAAAWLLASALISACSSGDNRFAAPPDASDVSAVVATRAADFSSGAVRLINAETLSGPDENLAPTISDILVRAAGEQYFVIERFDSNTIKRFDLEAPNTPNLTASTQDPGDTAQSNPAELLIVSPTKGYLLRYGAGTVWIVNPSATTEAGFKTGEIDLSHYDADGVPEMTAGVIDQGLLFIAMQRLENFASVKSGYVAVIDIGSDEEVDTGNADLPGIELPLQSPTALIIDPASSDLLAVGSGGFDGSFTPVYAGGIARIDTGAFTAELLLDDGNAENAPFGQFGELVAISGTQAYFTAGEPFGLQTLYRFDPSSDADPLAVDGFNEKELGALAVDPLGRLWVARADSDAPGISVLDVSGNSEVAVGNRIGTSLIPINIDFAVLPDINN